MDVLTAFIQHLDTLSYAIIANAFLYIDSSVLAEVWLSWHRSSGML
jgi:hypothetical protein